MIEYNQDDQAEPGQPGAGVKVIGVGGAGANVLDRMALEGSDDAALLTLNTDVRALSTSVSSDKIQLGTTLLKGMGTGGDPSLGKQAALEAVDGIREAVRGNEMVFVCVGLGGGTGSGSAPEVCRIAKEEGIFLVVFATMPFSFEGQRRMDQAKESLETIGRYANAVITFDNDRMGELIVPKDGVTQAFSAADKIISQSIRATMNVVFRPGIIRIGMDDLLSAIDSEDSRCLFGYGVSKGENRAHEALEQALKCPLLDRGKLLEDSDAVLVQVAGGDTMTLFEVQMVMSEVAKHVGPQSQILFGTGTDKRLGNSLSVTILSSVSGPDAGGAKKKVEADAPALSEPAPVSLGMSAAPASVSISVGETQPIQPSQPVAEEAAPEEVEEEVSYDEPEPESEIRLEIPEEEPVEEEPPAFEEEEEVYEEEADESAVFEPLQEEEVPSYSPSPIPPQQPAAAEEAFVEDEDEGEEDFRNPIARAVGQADEGAEVDRVEAVTESSQKITLSRMVSSGKTGRIKTRDSLEAADAGPALPPSRPPSLPPEQLEPAELSEEARAQQEMLQLEPVGGAKKGRFAKTDPTIVDGEDLDVPTFLRKKK
ncbi:MAG: cell division protein FtsZ [Verrucomicrobiales bacterium]|nr:cell division protein FtsZ [Verrucomicrobiales bacterium]